MNILIRPMTIQDYDEVYTLWDKTPGIGLSDADSRANIYNYLEHNPGFSFVARDGSQLVGAVLCGHDSRRGYLHHLAVSSDYHNLGIGRQLAEKCLAALAQVGIQKCHIFVFETNQNAREFWSHIGWKTRSDIVLMSKDIPNQG
jgi:ribosomal protein S18 acetylase RimI-like enzyme